MGLISQNFFELEVSSKDNSSAEVNVQRFQMLSPKGRLPRNLKGHNLDISWSGSAWACGKQLKHYLAFRRNGILISSPVLRRAPAIEIILPMASMVLEQRVENLERELDASISAAARARTEKCQAEAAQKAAELRAQEITKVLENTSKVFELHMEELRAKQQEISKRDKEIKLLEAIIQTLGGRGSLSVDS